MPPCLYVVHVDGRMSCCSSNKHLHAEQYRVYNSTIPHTLIDPGALSANSKLVYKQQACACAV